MHYIMAMLAAVTVAMAEVPEGWFEFTIGEPTQGSIADVSAYNGEAAGASGFVTISDGKFVDGAGERIRFLGTNLTFAHCFPDKDQAPEIAERMARLGINCVRFHHMDCHHAPRGIWDPDYDDHQHIDSSQLDKLDWMIYQLKQRGIYTNINLHVSRQFNEADGFENVEGLPKYDKGVDNFQPRMIQLQKQYARQLLTHVNPYTENAYVDEPCVAMVELNNENSALRFAMGTTFHNLPQPYRGQLKGLWIEWLRSKYGDTHALSEAWQEASEPMGTEMLRNVDFSEGTDEWVLEAPDPAEGAMAVVEDEKLGRVLHAELTELGRESWHFQVHQVGHHLEDGRVYTVQFAIKADPPRTVNVATRYDVPDWRNVGLRRDVDATREWKHHEFVFRADEPKPDHTRLSFNCQNQLGEVWIGKLSLRPGGYLGLPKDQFLEDGNVTFPSDSAMTQARADWFEFFIDIERKYTQGMYELLKDELGSKAQVVDTQATYGELGGVWREAQLDYIDTHSYWQHPHFPGRPWDPGNWTIANTPMTDAFGSDTLTRLAQYRVADTPFTVSEYNHPAPNDYRAECMPMFAAFAGLQDWDGIFQFCYGGTPDDWSSAKIDGYFGMAADPAKLAFFPVAANLFRRGDVSALASAVTLVVPAGNAPIAELMQRFDRQWGQMGEIWQSEGIERKQALERALNVRFADDGTLRLQQIEALRQWRKPQVQWTEGGAEGGRFIVDTPKTKIALGAVADQQIEFEGLELDIGQTENGWAAVALTSMDDRSIGQSERMLLVAASRIENQDMGWDQRRRTVGRKWGHGPPIAEGVPVTLRFKGRSNLGAYALDGTASRKAAVESEADADGAFQFGPQYGTIWYEIAVE